MPSTLFFAILWFLFVRIDSEGFDHHFKKFLMKNYGVKPLQAFARDDIENTGSFGGGITNESYRAVVLVHGLSNQAGNFWKIRRDFVAAGFPKAKIFATTYGEGEASSFLGFGDAMKCEYVKQIRSFIEVIAAYSERKVDVIGYSMGAPISRKAILGGKCVDTNEDLGPALSNIIHTYISVAGPNQGSELCNMEMDDYEICNSNNGLVCGSDFLNDINSRERYEGMVSYSLASKKDQMIGYTVCDKKSAHFAGARDIEFDRLYHEQVEFDTAETQLKILRQHKEDIVSSSNVLCFMSVFISVLLLL